MSSLKSEISVIIGTYRGLMKIFHPKNWILENSVLDFLLILLPGWIGVVLAWNFPENSLWMAAYAFFAVVFVDTGHTYTTWWRTIFRKEERQTHVTYWLTPLLIVIVVFAWIKLKIPYLWSVVVYNAIFHQIRQYYGVVRWYQKLNGRFCRISNRFLYTLLVMPFVLFHFRGIDWIILYSQDELFLYPSQMLFRWGVPVYLITIAAWIVFELSLIRKGIYELNRFLAMLVPISIYGIGFTLGDTLAEVLFPILLAHGIPYIAIMDISLRRLNPHIFKTFATVFGLLVFTAVIFSVFEDFTISFLTTLNQAYRYKETTSTQAFLTGVVLTPLFCHFVWDAYIWKGTHHEARTVYSPNTVESK